MMVGWLFIGLAVMCNVATNVGLKRLVAGVPEGVSAMGLPLYALGSPWFWFTGCAGMGLLGFYALALRSVELSVSYALVTASALIGIYVASVVFLDETLSWQKTVGVSIIILGIFVLTRSPGAASA